MFRDMRRKKQELSREETIEMLNAGTSGVLAVSGDGGYPYAVPLSYALDGERLFFHCAREGHKIDGIQQNDRVSFCVIARDEVNPQKFSTRYRSAIVFGRARILDSEAERRYALERLVEKYSPAFSDEGQKEIERSLEYVCIIELKIEHITGKAAL